MTDIKDIKRYWYIYALRILIFENVVLILFGYNDNNPLTPFLLPEDCQF